MYLTSKLQGLCGFTPKTSHVHHSAFCPCHQLFQELKDQWVQLSFQGNSKWPIQCSHDQSYDIWNSHEPSRSLFEIQNWPCLESWWYSTIKSTIYLVLTILTGVTGDSSAQKRFNQMARGMSKSLKCIAVLFPQHTNFWQSSPWKSFSLPVNGWEGTR